MPVTEIRVEVDPSEVSVLDGYCSATGKNRSVVIRGLLKDWSNAKLHEATLNSQSGRDQSDRTGRRQEMTISIIVLGLLGLACMVGVIAIQLGAFDDMPHEISNVGDE